MKTYHENYTLLRNSLEQLGYTEILQMLDQYNITDQ